MYLNSLALQAVVERCTHDSDNAPNSNTTGGAIPFSTLTKWYRNDRHYIDEVIDARIYSGIHFRTSDEVGAWLGRDVARHVMRRELGPKK